MKAKLGNNPKDQLGIKKVSLTKLPAAGIIHGAHAMMYGAAKYGPYNWRDNAVVASIYIDATMRHLAAWFDEKEEIAKDSGVHHLGHVLANMAILLDAMETGNLLDDRPHSGKAAKVLERLNEVVRRGSEAQSELARSSNDSSRNSNSSLDVETGSQQPSIHSAIPTGKSEMVCSPGTPEDDATGYR